ncbi:MAG: hypothetical protein PVJ67_06750 [Candidatus Pacearchaeota archaeon]|jgi:hypothetical protein
MTDIFDNKILCKKCSTIMQKAKVIKNGFLARAVVCPKCKEKIIHPVDEEKYNKYINLKNKDFRVKMRLVGNSYAVSIPKEIVSFMRAHEKIMDDMVKLCFEDLGRLSLNFNPEKNIKEVFDKERLK